MSRPVVPPQDWEWHGVVGHFCGGTDCVFHMTTVVGDYFISTVGDYLPKMLRNKLTGSSGKPIEFEDVGLDRKFETMVFKKGSPCNIDTCDCRVPIPDEWSELDMQGYNTRGAAREGHLEMCFKWAAK